MPKNFNSASRLHSLLSQAAQYQPQNDQTLDVWAKLLGVNETNTHRKAFQVNERLRRMHHELALITVQMEKLDFSKHLYVNAIANCENSMSSMLLPQAWVTGKQYLISDTLLSLDFCSEILPDEESAISEDELNQIQDLVNELQSSISTSGLPSSLISLIQHHIELIQRALGEYPITGVKALREAAHTGLGELMEVKDSISVNSENPEISKLGALWRQVNTTADTALKAEKLAKLGYNAWELLGSVF